MIFLRQFKGFLSPHGENVIRRRLPGSTHDHRQQNGDRQEPSNAWFQ
jgi:hypothetical protein